MKEEQMLNECRETISAIFNCGIPNDAAMEMLADFPSSILSKVLIDTFNRVHGCFQFNETFVGEEA